MTALLVAVGAAVGAPLRFLLAHHLDDGVPWGTLLVNVLGSFLLGVCSGLALDGGALALAGTGFCGAFTTYSAFAVQTADRLRADDPRRGLLYAALTVLLAVTACSVGYAIGQS